MPSHSNLDLDTCKRLLDYYPETGIFIWKSRDASDCSRPGEEIRWNGRYAGTQAFRICPNGYRAGMVKRCMTRAHRLAWFMHYGRWPAELDHINGDRADNRIVNLREVTRTENTRNQKLRSTNKTGTTGVSQYRGRYRATIRDDGKQVEIGKFDTIDAAIAARKAAEIRIGYHPNHGRAA